VPWYKRANSLQRLIQDCVLITNDLKTTVYKRPLKLTNMKTLKTLLSSTLTAVLLSATVLTSNAAEVIVSPTAMSVANPDIKKIVVTGNTRVFIVQDNRESVSMNDEDLSKVSVKQVGNTLTISSSEHNPVDVTVYVKDIYRIDASNTAVVKTVGKLNVEFLQVMLKDNAAAHIKTNTESLYTVIGDHANLELLGATAKHIVKTNGSAVLKADKFAALTTSRESIDADVAMNAELANAELIVNRSLRSK
jgi:hypothetical protein